MYVRAVMPYIYIRLNIFSNNVPLTVGIPSPSTYAQTLTYKAVALLGTAGKFYRSDEI